MLSHAVGLEPTRIRQMIDGGCSARIVCHLAITRGANRDRSTVVTLALHGGRGTVTSEPWERTYDDSINGLGQT